MQPFLRLQLRLQLRITVSGTQARPNIRRQQHDHRRQTRFFDSANTGKQHLQAARDRLPVIVRTAHSIGHVVEHGATSGSIKFLHLCYADRAQVEECALHVSKNGHHSFVGFAAQCGTLCTQIRTHAEQRAFLASRDALGNRAVQFRRRRSAGPGVEPVQAAYCRKQSFHHCSCRIRLSLRDGFQIQIRRMVSNTLGPGGTATATATATAPATAVAIATAAQAQ